MEMPESPYRAPRGQRLREAHCHVAQLGIALRMVDLEGCRDATEMIDRVATGARLRVPGRELVLAEGARPESWDPPGWPSLAQIDAITGDAPFCGWCFDYHALMANSASLRLAGIGPDTRDRPGGIIGRDTGGGLTGVVYEDEAARVWDAALGPDGFHALAIESLADAHAALRVEAGFTEIHDLKAQPWLGPALASLAQDSPGTEATYVLWPLVDDLGRAHAGAHEWASDAVRLGGGKIFVDGTLNSRTAWMLNDYADAETAGRDGHPRGLPMMTPDEIDDAVRRCDALGLPMAAHAIGDAAVRAVLDSIERVRPRTPGFRIEHAEFVDEADVPRFAALGVVCSPQPCHLLYDIEALRRAVPDRLERVLPLRSLIDAGCEPGELMIFGSDAPIVRPDPGDSVLAAVERRRVGMAEGDAIGLAEAITVPEAWRCFGASDG